MLNLNNVFEVQTGKCFWYLLHCYSLLALFIVYLVVVMTLMPRFVPLEMKLTWTNALPSVTELRSSVMELVHVVGNIIIIMSVLLIAFYSILQIISYILKLVYWFVQKTVKQNLMFNKTSHLFTKLQETLLLFPFQCGSCPLGVEPVCDTEGHTHLTSCHAYCSGVQIQCSTGCPCNEVTVLCWHVVPIKNYYSWYSH